MFILYFINYHTEIEINKETNKMAQLANID